MKKVIVILLTIAMLFTLVVPVSAYTPRGEPLEGTFTSPPTIGSVLEEITLIKYIKQLIHYGKDEDTSPTEPAKPNTPSSPPPPTGVKLDEKSKAIAPNLIPKPITNTFLPIGKVKFDMEDFANISNWSDVDIISYLNSKHGNTESIEELTNDQKKILAETSLSQFNSGVNKKYIGINWNKLTFPRIINIKHTTTFLELNLDLIRRKGDLAEAGVPPLVVYGTPKDVDKLEGDYANRFIHGQWEFLGVDRTGKYPITNLLFPSQNANKKVWNYDVSKRNNIEKPWDIADSIRNSSFKPPEGSYWMSAEYDFDRLFWLPNVIDTYYGQGKVPVNNWLTMSTTSDHSMYDYLLVESPPTDITWGTTSTWYAQNGVDWYESFYIQNLPSLYNFAINDINLDKTGLLSLDVEYQGLKNWSKGTPLRFEGTITYKDSKGTTKVDEIGFNDLEGWNVLHDGTKTYDNRTVTTNVEIPSGLVGNIDCTMGITSTIQSNQPNTKAMFQNFVTKAISSIEIKKSLTYQQFFR